MSRLKYDKAAVILQREYYDPLLVQMVRDECYKANKRIKRLLAAGYTERTSSALRSLNGLRKFSTAGFGKKNNNMDLIADTFIRAKAFNDNPTSSLKGAKKERKDFEMLMEGKGVRGSDLSNLVYELRYGYPQDFDKFYKEILKGDSEQMMEYIGNEVNVSDSENNDYVRGAENVMRKMRQELYNAKMRSARQLVDGTADAVNLIVENTNKGLKTTQTAIANAFNRYNKNK